MWRRREFRCGPDCRRNLCCHHTAYDHRYSHLEKLLPYGFQDDPNEGKKPENKKRNRFLELYPYDHSRVILKPEVDGDCDYINASYINGYTDTKTCIAAQGPNQSTVDDFWRMIWQENVSHIVMLTKVMELTKTICEQYWPDVEEMGEFGNIRVHHKDSTVRRDYTIRRFKITHAVHKSDTREITQLHFTSWLDHDVPSAPSLVSFWKQLQRLHQEQDTGPVVVHCSTGMGQTGTFIALEWLFEEAEREKKVNVFNCVNQMRKARMNMIQTTSQYRFLHEVVLEAVRSKNTLYTDREFQLKFGTENIFTGDQNREIQREFETLNTLRRPLTEKQVSDARLPENLSKNRDQNILPANIFRPNLTTVVTGRNQYINAVVLPSCVRHSALIATQTPLPDTVVDFWRLVYDHDIINVICLEDYEIMYPSKDAPVETGPFQICLDKKWKRESSCTQSQISLKYLMEPTASRQITVYRPGNARARPSDLLEFVNEMGTRGVFKQGQVLAHCNNGSDLSGLFCAVLNVITRLRLDQEVDIFLDIRELQSIRPSFIHSLRSKTMSRVQILYSIPLLLGPYFETVLTQRCDEPCSTVTCSPPYYGTCCHKKNTAQGSQHTSQSSEFMERNRYFHSDLAVDGNTNTDFINFTCTHTGDLDLKDAWWKIDLESTYNISEMKLYLRNNNAQRYNGLRLLVNSTECFRLNETFSFGATPPEDHIRHIHCSPPIPGSLVSVTVDSGFLTLCEVQIFVCDPGWYGEECDRQCNCRDSADCDKTTGWCRDGCRAGKQGHECQCDCPNGTYGLNCRESCGHCLDGTVCDETNGICYSGCVQGYIAPLCQDCVPGWYGTDCKSNCGQCADNVTCGRDGTCPRGCLPGFTAGLCQTEVQEDGSNVAAIAGGISTVILLLLVVVVVIIILKRRRIQRKPKMTVESRNDSQKDTTFIDISARKKPKDASSEQSEKSAIQTPGKTDLEVCSKPSTGSSPEYYNVIPAPIILPKLAQYIKDKVNGVGFDDEFKLLPYETYDDRDGGKISENKKITRFLELFPYNHSRVILKPEVDGDCDYINASYITGYRNTKNYIAAQGPNQSTVDDFWRMIWQENVSHIVMLTKLMELTRYWPDDKEMGKFGNIKVQHMYSTVPRDYIIRRFKIEHSVYTSDTREVTQLQFTSWPDDNVPSAQALVTFWKQFRRLHQEHDTGHVVVHCSTGMGQTGTFIALDWLFEEAERDKKVNVFNCVKQMRKARMNMVQTVSQYRFLHEVVLEAVRSKNTFYTSREFQLKFGTGNTFTGDQKREIQREFEALNTLRKTFTEEQVSDARLPENFSKNRDQNILPDNKSRPNLATVVTGRNTFINAVVLPSYVRHSALIATQTPLPDTVVDFWRLIFDHGIVNVICLEDYEILYPNIDAPMETGPFQICLDKWKRGSSFTQSQISLTCLLEPKASRQFTVYRPSYTRPSDLLDFVNEMETRGIFKQGQVLVHCNNGSDLCGLFCGVLNIITRLRLDREVDIFLDIRELQSIRPSFIQSLDQYRFCFDAVKEYQRSTIIYENV